MTRKAPTFEQLAMYIDRDADGSVCFSRNINYAGHSPKVTAAIFASNHRYLPPRKNGNALYHMVLVLPTQPHLDRKEQKKILQDLGDRFCAKFAPGQLAWGRAHFNTDNPHIHLMISSNEACSKTRRRLDKASFARIQREMEAYKEQRFPQLEDTAVYNRQKSIQKSVARIAITSAEGELVRRTNQPSRKQAVRDLLYDAMRRSRDKGDLECRLAGTGFALYQRGRTWSVINLERGTKYRIKTLGLDPEFTALLNRRLPVQPPRQLSPAPDERAQRLLQSRQNLEAIAERELDGFDRETGR